MSELIPNNTLMSFIERASRDEAFNVDKFGELLRMQRELQLDQARRAFNAAMAVCQAEMEPVIRNAMNDHTRSKYAKLEAIDAKARPVYTRHGFSVRFGSAPHPTPGWMRITCTVAHEAGFSEENYLDSPVSLTGSQGGRTAMTQVQAVGAVVTYLRRYLLGMVFNLVQADLIGDDTDGHVPGPDQRLPERPRAAWEAWLAKLRTALVGLDPDAVAEQAGRPSVVSTLEHGPDWVKAEAQAILSEAYEVAAKAADEAEKAATGDMPFPDLAIKGEEKLGAG